MSARPVGLLKDRADAMPAALLLILCFLLSGGGSDYVLNETLLKLAALPVAGYYAAGFAGGQPDRAGWQPLGLIALAFALPLFQLIPLPPGFWRNLPGHGLGAEILDALGQGHGARPLSLDPAATLRWLTGLLPGAAMLVAVLHLGQRDRLMLAQLVVLLALISLAVGALQLVTAGQWGVIYPSAHAGYPTGLFANRNHQATLLLIAIPLAAASGKGHAEHAPWRWLMPMLCLPFAAGVLATTSRMGLILLPVSLLAAALLLLGMPDKRARWLAPAILLVAAGGVMLLLRLNGVVAHTLNRLESGNVDRLAYWRGTLRAIADYWPAGSGMGTFVPVYRSVERLADVSPYYPNHAHNDFLEFVLEGGAPAALLLVLGLLWLALATWALRRRSGSGAQLGWAALAGLILLLLHSCVDYPVRILFLEAVGALLAGFLLPEARQDGTLPGLQRIRPGSVVALPHRLHRASGRRRSFPDGTGSARPDRHIGIGDAHHAHIPHAVDSELPIGPTRVIIAQRHGRIDNRRAVAPDAEVAGQRIGRDFPDPMDPAPDSLWRRPPDHRHRRLRRQPLRHRMGEDALNAMLRLHGDDRRQGPLLRFGGIVQLTDDRRHIRGAAGCDILEIADGRRPAEGQDETAEQLRTLEGPPPRAVIARPVAGPDGHDDTAIATVEPKRVSGRRSINIFRPSKYFDLLDSMIHKNIQTYFDNIPDIY